jgi:hypothetical protein
MQSFVRYSLRNKMEETKLDLYSSSRGEIDWTRLVDMMPFEILEFYLPTQIISSVRDILDLPRKSTNTSSSSCRQSTRSDGNPTQMTSRLACYDP